MSPSPRWVRIVPLVVLTLLGAGVARVASPASAALDSKGEPGTTQGAKTCARCGLVDELVLDGDVVVDSRRTPGDGTKWFESICGPCKPHEWCETGCWTTYTHESSIVSCTELPSRHALHAFCSKLADTELALSVARRFASLTPADRVATFVTTSTLDARMEHDAARLGVELRAWSATGPLSVPFE